MVDDGSAVSRLATVNSCPGFCGRQATTSSSGNVTYSNCQACSWGHRSVEKFLCSSCDDLLPLYDWLYLLFVALVPLLLNSFFVQLYAAPKSTRQHLFLQHLCCLLECVLSALFSLLLMPPFGTPILYSCTKNSLRDWYPVFYNPVVNHTHILRCTQEIVFPLHCKSGGWLTCWNVQICCITDIAWTSEEPISRNVVEEEMHMDVVATIIISFSLTLLARPANGSAGDRHHIYLSCVKSCILKYGCPQKYDESGWIFSECFRCRYKCTWKTVKYFNDILHLSVPQFYGKWPFLAIWLPFIMPIPIQEFASVIFSILNLFTTFSMYQTVKRLRSSNRLKIVWTAYSVIGIIMWTCSAIFHWADFWLTEYLDYFTACAFIVFALFVSISFTIKSLQNCYRGRILWSFLFIVLLYLYTNHIYNLTIDFDYGYNMKMCLACSLLTAIIYCVWLVQQWKLRDHSGRRSLLYLTIMVIWGLLSILLEVLDFVPIYWIIDSHSLFHLATVPLPLLLTRFILLENAYEMQQQIGNIKQT